MPVSSRVAASALRRYLRTPLASFGLIVVLIYLNQVLFTWSNHWPCSEKAIIPGLWRLRAKQQPVNLTYCPLDALRPRASAPEAELFDGFPDPGHWQDTTARKEDRDMGIGDHPRIGVWRIRVVADPHMPRYGIVVVAVNGSRDRWDRCMTRPQPQVRSSERVGGRSAPQHHWPRHPLSVPPGGPFGMTPIAAFDAIPCR